MKNRYQRVVLVVALLPLLLGGLSCKKGTLTDTVIVVSGSTTPALGTPTTMPSRITSYPTIQPQEIGKVLDIKIEFGNGNAWTGGIVLSEPRFVAGLLNYDFDVPMWDLGRKKGDPCVCFSGVLTNNSNKGWYVSFWTDPLRPLTWAGIPGRAEYFIPAGVSQSFNIALTYETDVHVITMGAQIMDMPSP